MAKRKEREEALQMRLKGASYSQIKQKIPVAKSTLSIWLADHPLSKKRVQELRDRNPKRIESFRNTMQQKREEKQQVEYRRAKKDLGDIKQQEIFTAGFFLYWAEGSKTQTATVALANTDPEMLKFFIQWLELLGVSRNKLKVYLHLYSDMDQEEKKRFWSKQLQIPTRQFRNPYIKNTTLAGQNYKGRFGHGTCNVLLYDRAMRDYILMGIRYLKETCVSPAFPPVDRRGNG